MTDIIELAEAAIAIEFKNGHLWPGIRGVLRELVAELKDARAEAQSHQETVMHANDALSMVQGESRRQLEEIDKLKRHVRYLELAIQEEVGSLSYAERDELDELSREFV